LAQRSGSTVPVPKIASETGAWTAMAVVTGCVRQKLA
jgi:hypothetical protein